MRILTTGFGPFGEFDENPSAWLVEQCGQPHVVLPVSYRKVDEFIEGLDPDMFDVLVMAGVHGSAKKIHLEEVARNSVGDSPDVDGERGGPGLIEPEGPPTITSSIWSQVWWPEADVSFQRTDDAGSYLCNWVFYRASMRFPAKRVGFVHVPAWTKMDKATQARAFSELLSRLTSGA